MDRRTELTVSAEIDRIMKMHGLTNAAEIRSLPAFKHYEAIETNEAASIAKHGAELYWSQWFCARRTYFNSLTVFIWGDESDRRPLPENRSHAAQGRMPLDNRPRVLSSLRARHAALAAREIWSDRPPLRACRQIESRIGPHLYQARTRALNARTIARDGSKT